MNSNQNLFQRFFSDIPLFERIAQTIALILIAVISHLKGDTSISPTLLNMVTGVLAGIAFFAQFAQKDIQEIKGAFADPSTFMTVVTDLLSQFAQLKDTLVGHAATTTENLQSISNSLTTIASAPLVEAPAEVVANVATQAAAAVASYAPAPSYIAGGIVPGAPAAQDAQNPVAQIIQMNQPPVV